MIDRTLTEIAQMSGAVGLNGPWDSLRIHGVTKDSRNVPAGSLYIPIIGERFDGHDFAADAFARGAVASLWQQDRPNPPEGVPLVFVEDTLVALQTLASAYRDQLPVRVIGITGSNGKTTSKDMVASILGTTYRTHKTAGNLNNHIGLPLTLLQLDEGTEMAVVEMGMSGRGEIELLSRIAKPEAAIVTNIGEAHLLQLGSRKEIARAKLEILSGLQPGGLFVYNGDEPLIEEVMGSLELPDRMLRFRFGLTDSNDYYPVATMLDGKGTFFSIGGTDMPNCYIPLLGRHNVINALAAIAVGQFMGVSWNEIVRGLETMEATGMRIEVVTGVSGLTILNDAYNASPTSVFAALDLFRDMKGYRRKVVVLGDMLELGDREREFHREIGRALREGDVDYVFTFGNLAAFIAEEAAANFSEDRVRAPLPKDEIIRCISRLVDGGDIVLVKGSRGMKLEEVVHGLQTLQL